MARHRKIPLNMQVPRKLLTASILNFKTLSYYFNKNKFCGFKDVSDMPDKFDTNFNSIFKTLTVTAAIAELPR